MIRHYLRLERKVRLGGVHLGPLRIPFTGKVYPVRPMTVLQWTDYVTSLARMARLGAPKDEAQATLWMALLPIQAMRPLAAVMVSEPLRQKDLGRITKGQMTALFKAMEEVNDLPFITQEFSPQKTTGRGSSQDWGMEDSVDAMVQARPCYTHDDYLRMPVQKFFSMSRTLERRAMEADRAAAGIGKSSVPHNATPASAEELDAIRQRLRAKRIQVN